MFLNENGESVLQHGDSEYWLMEQNEDGTYEQLAPLEEHEFEFMAKEGKEPLVKISFYQL